jgi:hypothetical protein
MHCRAHEHRHIVIVLAHQAYAILILVYLTIAAGAMQIDQRCVLIDFYGHEAPRKNDLMHVLATLRQNKMLSMKRLWIAMSHYFLQSLHRT